GLLGSKVPKVDAEAALSLYLKLHEAIDRGLVRSAHDCSDGGLFVALAEVCMAGRLGARIDLARLPVDEVATPLTHGAKLFSESQSRFVVTVSPKHAAAFDALMAGLPSGLVGEITHAPVLEILETNEEDREADAVIVTAGLDEMFDKWRRPLDW
ncbi:MAG TPA: AIR synthase-related protein, partial [Fibrobacteria bacterium]|nr:AIR synthase-related protein [Fibrobacteria bacterium]